MMWLARRRQADVIATEDTGKLTMAVRTKAEKAYHDALLRHIVEPAPPLELARICMFRFKLKSTVWRWNAK